MKYKNRGLITSVIIGLLILIGLSLLLFNIVKNSNRDSIYKNVGRLDNKIELPSFDVINFKPATVDITASDVNSEIDRIRVEKGRNIEVKEGTVHKGDKIKYSYAFIVNDKVDSNHQGSSEIITLGYDDNYPGFEDNVVGMKVGETKTFDFTIGEQKGQMEVTIEAKIKTEKAEYTDEFVKSVSKYDNKKDYEKYIKKKLQKELDERLLVANRNAVWNMYVSACDVNDYITDEMIDREVKLLDYEYEDIMRSKGYTGEIEDFIKNQYNMSMEEYNRQNKQQAFNNAKSKFVAELLISKYDIKLDKTEFTKYEKDQLKELNLTESDVELGQYSKDRGWYENYSIEQAAAYVYDNVVK